MASSSWGRMGNEQTVQPVEKEAANSDKAISPCLLTRCSDALMYADYDFLLLLWQVGNVAKGRPGE